MQTEQAGIQVVDKDFMGTMEVHGIFSDKKHTREQILRLEEEALKFTQEEQRLKHYFANGVYGRELFLPKGAIVIGKVHKFSQLNILLSGEVTVTIDDSVTRIKAPCVVSSPAGIKRAAFAHEDSLWLTISHTNNTDLSIIENELVCDNDAYLGNEERLKVT